MIDVLLLDDHQVVREGLRLILEHGDGMRVVAEASSVQEAKETQADPHVILADLNVKDMAGPQVVGELRTRFPDAGIVVVSISDSPGDVRLALSLGARGYVLKDAASTELITAIQAVAQGGSYLQPSLGALVIGTKQSDRLDTDLTAREIDVLALVALGHTNSEIAKQLSTSERTVESHRRRISQKLGTTTRAGLVRHALEIGLLDLYRKS
jgi:two-component system, NarL family, response regulator NreC